MRKRDCLVAGVVFALALVAFDWSPASPARANAADTLLINGAGATFPYPIYAKWFDEYHKNHPDIQINYQSIGSGGGIRQLLAGTVDFGASDGPMTNEQLAQAKVKILHFPTVLGAVVPTYNVPGITQELKFTPEALAGIFLGTVKKWNDSELVKGQSRRQTAGQRHRGGTPVRGQRNYIRLDRLPFENQPGMEEQSGHGSRR